MSLIFSSRWIGRFSIALALPLAGCSSGSDDTAASTATEGGTGGTGTGGSSSAAGGVAGSTSTGVGGSHGGSAGGPGAGGQSVAGSGGAGGSGKGGHAGTNSSGAGGSAGTSPAGGSGGQAQGGAGVGGGAAGDAGAGGLGIGGGGGGAGAGGDAGGSAGASVGGASGQGGSSAVSSPPQVVSSGGKVLTQPKVQVIAYEQDDEVADIEAFLTEFSGGPIWAAQTKEYGVGPLTVLPIILIPGVPPKKLDDSTDNSPFEQTLIGNITGANPAWGSEDGQTMYLFVLPSGTNIDSGGNCCSDFYGYHYEATAPSGGVPYGVVCRCGGGGDPLTPLQNTTTTLSHELVETATDPFTGSDLAFGQTDDADAIWTIATGGEVADMCQYNLDTNYTPPGAKYMIQRSWSNAAAKAGENPCVPAATTEPYFNTYPVLSDAITLDYYFGPWATNGVNIPVGQTKTIDVVLHSETPTSGPWTVTAYDLNDFLGAPANTTVSLDKTSGVEGDVLHLTIKVNSYDSQTNGAGFVLESTLNGQDNLSFGAIGK